MSTRPTPGQLAQSRVRVEQLLTHGDIPMEYIGDVMAILAATEPPTDKEIMRVASDEAPGIMFQNPERGFVMNVAIATVHHFLGPVKP